MPFAATNRTFEDKQQSRVPGCPQEVWSHGFTPPVRLPDGRVQRGDVLPASWFNDIMSRVYQAAEAIPAAATTDNAVPTAVWEPAAGTTGIGPWAGIHCGPLTIEVGVFGTGSAEPGKVIIQTPIKAGTKPHLYLIDLSDPGAGAAGKLAFCADENAGQSFQFYSRMLTRQASGGAGLFVYICILERMDSWTPITSFCPNPRNFVDGQTSFTAPTPDQQLYGFAPARMESGNLIAGDTLPANVLNYLLHDMTASLGVVGWEIKPSTYGNDYRIVIGDMQIVSSRYNVAAAPSAGVALTYPFAFGAADPSTQIFTFGLPTAMSAASAAVTAPKDNASFVAAVRKVETNDTTGAGIASAMWGLSIGPAPAGVSRKWRKVPALLNGFANQAKTYADGQLNKVAPVADRQAAGFIPNRKIAGAATPGDFVTANELNYMLNYLYGVSAAAVLDSGIIAADTTKKITGGGYIKLGFLLIQWNTLGLAAGDYDSNSIRRQSYAKPFRANKAPFVFLSDAGVSETASMVFTTNSGSNGRLTNTTVDFTGVRVNNGALTTLGQARMLAIGVAP